MLPGIRDGGREEVAGRKEEFDYKGEVVMEQFCVLIVGVVTQISACDVCIDIMYTYIYTCIQVHVKSAKSE